MAELPRRAQVYIASVVVLALGASVIAVIAAPPRLDHVPIALLLLVAATVAQQFKAKSPQHQSYYTTTIFFFSAALLLRPAFIAAVIIVAHVAELVRVRYRWYITVFNISNFLLCSLAASAIFGLGHGPGLTVFAAVLAGCAFVVLNHVLTALVITWARNVPITKTGTLDWENVGTDIALISVGTLGALLWLSDPWLAPLTLGPLFLIYRSLWIPTLREEARTDPKTGLANMKHWNEVAQVEIDRARRFGRPLSVALADVDLLREINNRYGHLVGDQMIRRVAQEIRTALRDYDLPARFGGDEFAILMPETSLHEALQVAERIRQGVETIDLRGADGTRSLVSLSMGVALFPAHGRTAADLLAAADRAVYQAKARGRNRVAAFADAENENLRVLPAAPVRLEPAPTSSAVGSSVAPHARV